MQWDLEKLPWLPPAPSDCNERIQEIENTSLNKGSLIYQLATHNLNVNQLTKLGKIIKKSLQEDEDLSPLRKVRMAILSNSTICVMGPALVGAAARYGIALDLFIPSYDQVMQEAINPESPLNTSEQDLIMIHLDHRAFPLQNRVFGDLDQEQNVLSESMNYMNNIVAGIRSHSKAPLIFQTIPKIPTTIFGNIDRRIAGTYSRFIELFNIQLIDLAIAGKDYFIDTANLAERVGLDRWHNPQHWNMYKISFEQTFVPLYVDFVGRLLGSVYGNSKKCLVLDLDNTLWGGVIGDDGVEGIILGQGNPAGESFLEIQQMALTLRDRGIILAVCSKNEDATARIPFRNHPEMLIKEEHISAFVANWTNKADNLKEIAKTLNIGVDSLVLLDDNPAERAQVRSVLPMVGVPELLADPVYFSRALLSAGYFETVTFSEEDLKRSEQYTANAKRSELMTQVGDLKSYLKSLEMHISFAHFDQTGLSRITQLINKSNQFNLTTRRYTETEIQNIMKDPNYFTLQVRLTDRFGDNGMISVIICRTEDQDTWYIDTWIMSCRVLGRCVEQVVLNELVEQAQLYGIKMLKGHFIETGRNELVRDHYKKLNFMLEFSQEETNTLNGPASKWSLNIENYHFAETPMMGITRNNLRTASQPH